MSQLIRFVVSFGMFLCALVYISVLKILLSKDGNLSPPVEKQAPTVERGTTNINNPSVVRVLVARTMSEREVDNVVRDAEHFLLRKEEMEIKVGAISDAEENLSRNQACSLIHQPEPQSKVGPSTRLHPNRIWCGADYVAERSFHQRVEVSFLIFDRGHVNDGVRNDNSSRLSSMKRVEVVSVTGKPGKIRSWFLHVTPERLRSFDCVWFVDGDVQLSSVNWSAFWQAVAVLRPRISQPAVIGSGKGKRGTDHPVLRPVKDARVFAAETFIVEMMAPLIEVDTWLQFRETLWSDDIAKEAILGGGEQGIDYAWCHFARRNFVGNQTHPEIPSV